MYRLISCSLALAGALLAASQATAQSAKSASKQSTSITFHAEEAYPESVAWSPRQDAFFVGSLRKGTIGKVSPSGAYKAFASDTRMFGTSGIKYDARRNWVWAALCDIGVATKTSPNTQGKIAAIIAFDATSGKRKRFIDLAPLVEGPRCANDLAFDPEGNIYVTDSFAPVVYVVDKRFTPRVLVRSKLFTGENFNLNGIVYHPDGYLLVGKHNSGELFRITLMPTPEVFPVHLSTAIPGADGIELLSPGSVVAAQNSGYDRAVQLNSGDGWRSAEVVELAKAAASFPVAVTWAGDELYLLVNRVDTLITPTAVKLSDYLLQNVSAGAGR